MIHITSDLHGEYCRFKEKSFRVVKKNDTLIVCGDFGFVWDDSEEERKKHHKISKLKYTILFVEGCSDNYELLKTYPLVTKFGNEVREILPNVYQLLRGNVYTIENQTFFAFGGGETQNTYADQNTWWSEELPSSTEIEHARKNLQNHDFKVDYIITHESNSKTKSALTRNTVHFRINHLNIFFDELLVKVTFKKWFFGSYHLDRLVPSNQQAVFKAVHTLANTNI